MANEKEVFGAPQVLITFKTKATTAIARSARGIVVMILKNEKTDTMGYYKINDVTDIPAEGLTEANVDLIKKCLLGTPLRVLVYTIPDDSVEVPTVTQASVLKQIANVKWNYICNPTGGAQDMEDLASWIKTMRNNKYKTFKAVVANQAADDKGEDIESLTTEERPYTMGAGLLPEEFEEKLVGLKKGQTAEFDLDMPANPPVLLRALKDKTEKIHFDVEVKAVRKKILPEVTDEWVKETLGFENVEELRTRLAESLTAQKKSMLPGLKERACLNKLIERMDVEVPAARAEAAEANLLQELFQQLQASGMSFDAYLQQMGMKAESFKDDIKLQAADNVKQDLALDAWGRHFDMQVSDADVTMEFVKSGVEDPAALEEEWRNNGQLHMVREGVLRTKAVMDLMDKAVVTEVQPKADDEKPAKKAAKKAAKADDAE